MTPTPAVPARAGLREWLGLAVLALPTLLVAMDISVLHLAVPELTADLRPSATELLWIVDAYGFLIAGFLIPMGVLGDRVGRRRLLLAGGAAFGAASALVAFAPTAESLIAGRALLGVAGATLMPSTLALITSLFADPQQRTLAVGVWVASLSVGIVVGPIVGGALLEAFWWGSVFLLALPVMALLLALGPWLLPEARDPAPGRVDALSVGLALGAMLALAYGVKQLAVHGAGAAPLAVLAAAVALGAVFARRQRRLEDPLVDLSLFRLPGFAVPLAANALALLAVVGVFLLVTQHLQLVLGLGPLEAGLWLLPYGVAVIAGSLVASPVSRRWSPPAALAGGLAIAAAGLALLTRVEADSGVALVAWATGLLGLGAGPVLTLGTDMVVGAVAPERAGAASAISEAATELGGALGVALLGSLAAAVYRAELGPDGPQTLGAASEAASPAVGAARAAFADGLATAAGAGAVLVGATAAVSAVLLLPRSRRAATRQA
ncbi:MAG TPA: MFS transporter [Capillimicrobium sp.]